MATVEQPAHDEQAEHHDREVLAPQAQEHANVPANPAVALLKSMFPDFDEVVLQAVLDSVSGNQDAAIDVLLGMSDPSYVSTHQPVRHRTSSGASAYSHGRSLQHSQSSSPRLTSMRHLHASFSSRTNVLMQRTSSALGARAGRGAATVRRSSNSSRSRKTQRNLRRAPAPDQISPRSRKR